MASAPSGPISGCTKSEAWLAKVLERIWKGSVAEIGEFVRNEGVHYEDVAFVEAGFDTDESPAVLGIVKRYAAVFTNSLMLGCRLPWQLTSHTPIPLCS